MPCSFCKQTGHNISKCACSTILPLMQQLETTDNKTEYLQQLTMLQVKIIAIQFGALSSINNKKVYINFIIENDSFKNSHMYNMKNPKNKHLQKRTKQKTIQKQHFKTQQELKYQTYDTHIMVKQQQQLERQQRYNSRCISIFPSSHSCECSVCLEEVPSTNIMVLGCDHQFCVDCIIKTIKSTTIQNNCAICRSPITIKGISTHSKSRLISANIIY